MAGSNQAINLGGMLNQIAGTIGSGYTINGKNAGAAIGDTLANLARPDATDGSAESYAKLAEWASKNGRTEEALQANAMAEQRRQEQGAMEAFTGASQNATLAKQAGAQGDVAGVQVQLQKLREQAVAYQQANNYEGFKAVQSQMKEVQDQVMPAAQEKEVSNKAAGIVNLNKMLNDGGYYGKDEQGNDKFIPLGEQQKAAVEQQLRTLEADPAAARAATASFLQKHQENVIKKNLEEDKQVEAATPALMQAGSEDEIDVLLSKVTDPQVRAKLEPLAEMQRNTIARDQRRAEERLMAETPVVSDDDIADFQSKLEILPEAMRVQGEKMLEAYQTLDEKNMSNGVYQTKASRQLSIDSAAKLEKFINSAWASQVQADANRARDAEDAKQQSLMRARADTLVTPPEESIRNYQRVEGVSRAEAIDALSTQAEENYFNLLMEYDPEKAQKTLQDGVTIDKLVTKMSNGTSPAKVEAVLRDYYGYSSEQAEAITEAAVLRADRSAQKDSEGFFSGSFKDNGGTTELWRKFINHMTTLPEERGQ